MSRTLLSKQKCIPVILVALLGSISLSMTQGQQASALVNGIPTVDYIPTQIVDELTTLTFDANATDPDGHQLIFSLHNAPYGASINSTTGVFTWTPTEQQGSGVYRIDVVVSDGFVISSSSVLIIVNDVGGGGHGGGRPASLNPTSPGIGSSGQGSTNLFADPDNIPLDGTTNLVQESDPSSNGQLVSLIVQEPDGDVCSANGVSASIPVGGLSKSYPADFTLVTESGDGLCDTGDVGTYLAESEVNTNSGLVEDSTQFETDSPFVLPESPIGLIALLGSSVAAFSAFMLLRGQRSTI